MIAALTNAPPMATQSDIPHPRGLACRRRDDFLFSWWSRTFPAPISMCQAETKRRDMRRNIARQRRGPKTRREPPRQKKTAGRNRGQPPSADTIHRRVRLCVQDTRAAGVCLCPLLIPQKSIFIYCRPFTEHSGNKTD